MTDPHTATSTQTHTHNNPVISHFRLSHRESAGHCDEGARLCLDRVSLSEIDSEGVAVHDIKAHDAGTEEQLSAAESAARSIVLTQESDVRAQ